MKRLFLSAALAAVMMLSGCAGMKIHRGLDASGVNTNRFDVREPRKHDEIGIQSLRGGDVVGVHTVYYMGPGERIELTHHAHSRENFANGALRAARWISTQTPGRVYNMQDVLHS